MSVVEGHPWRDADDPRVGEIAVRRDLVRDSTICSDVDTWFQDDPGLRSIVVHAPDGVYLLTRSQFHQALVGPTGYGYALFGNKTLAALPRHRSMYATAEQSCESVTQQVLNGGHVADEEVLVQYEDGYGTVAVSALFDHLWHLSQCRARRLDSERRRLHALVDHASDHTLVIDRHGALKWANAIGNGDFPYANLLDGVDNDDMAAAWDLLAEAINGTDLVEGEFRFRYGASGYRLFTATFRGLLEDPSVRGIVVTMRDIEDERRLQNDLKQGASTDPLTGLANRHAVRARIDASIAEGECPTMLTLDLDGFKVINDRFGQATGDAVLQEISLRLRNLADIHDTVARLDGDSFAIVTATSGVELDFGERVRTALSAPIEIAGHVLRLSATIGIATLDRDSVDDGVLLIDHSALALAHAMSRGRNNVAVFEPAMAVAAQQRDAMRGRLRVALSTNAFSLVYQPQMSLDSKQPLRGFEALIRWPDHARGSIPPDEFIPLAEESGEIVEIGRWVLTGALDQLSEWHRYGASLTMAVNTSVRELAEADFAAFVRAELKRRRLDPALLEIEITETALATDDIAVMETLGQLRDLGVGIAVDDYGSGHASIAYLRRYPISTIKVDRTLVALLDQDEATASALLKSITDVAGALGFRSVVEGLETPEQAAQARQLGFDLGQGWHCGMPMSAMRASKLVAVARRDDSTPRTEDRAPDLDSFEATLAAFDSVNSRALDRTGESPLPLPQAPSVVPIVPADPTIMPQPAASPESADQSADQLEPAVSGTRPLAPTQSVAFPD